jgi:hypothetical protein
MSDKKSAGYAEVTAAAATPEPNDVYYNYAFPLSVENLGKDRDEMLKKRRVSAKQMEDNYSYATLKSQNVLRSTYKYMKKYYKPSPICLRSYFVRRLPFAQWILKYNFREDLLKDLVAGVTLGIVHIPQNMAYALMAGVPAINGLYVAFFNVLLYVIMGTSRHISTG